MLRLAGGFNAWTSAGHPGVKKGTLRSERRVDDLVTLLSQLNLTHLHEPLQIIFPTLGDMFAAFQQGGRVTFLERLKAAGVSKLPERQALASGLSKAAREGALQAVS
eukprot:4239728-Prymnesium_polylepis.1